MSYKGVVRMLRSTALLAEEDEFEFAQGIAEITRSRHVDYCLVV